MKYSSETVRTFAQMVLERAGMSAEDAWICADCLVTADLRGVSSHGMTHLADLILRIRAGTLDPKAPVELLQTAPSALKVNGHHCAGMVSAYRAMEKCVELAGNTGIALATICNANTYGLGAYYPLYAADHGMIGFAVCNTKAYAAPWGGADPVLGTNPISVALPAGKYPPMVIDMATMQSAVNKIALAMKEGRSIPEDWAVGPDGNLTTDPALAYQGALLPFGGYKGYGLQLLISVLAFALAGGDMDRDIPKAWVEADRPCSFGCLLGAIDISKFLPLEEFRQRTDACFDLLKSTRPSAGSDGVQIPGEKSAKMLETNLKEGLSYSDPVLNELKQLSRDWDVPFFG